MSEWISVKDRLPDRTDTYWCAFSNGGTWLSTFIKRQGVWIPDEDMGGATVTHWSPLPPPPKD